MPNQDEQIRILVVDDENDIRVILGFSFKESGNETVTAGTTDEALKLIAKERFDAVLADYKMPDGGGERILKEVGKMDEKLRPLVFIMSGHADIDEDDLSKKGAAGYIHKPVKAAEIIKTIRKVIVNRMAKSSEAS